MGSLKPHTPIPCPAHPTYDLTKVSGFSSGSSISSSSGAGHREVQAERMLAMGGARVLGLKQDWVRMAQVIQDALHEDAGDRGDITTLAT